MDDPSYDDLVRGMKEYHPAGRESAGVRAQLDIKLAQELSGAIRDLSQSLNTSSHEAATLNRRLIFLNWALVVLTVLLVILGIISLRGHN